ncbi:thioesterase family protein [Arthrobacter rhombi]|uniref:Carnitine 3-dehydrogenase / Carnitine 3-dehydratase @ 3-hydroxyacyl-CoA dehydrogenase / Enoyl-CoA hydratase n=1 Tax=Arthrobacter rhombi TaxID=71253 RepID=A0A1R4EPE7_9MICC|nr:thioesterase family protein [Arthrobacter rhombi]SJM45521.1 Carnitine 3-dehydrogenase / Carnitine 3-dehydratase @ 3-hydroxyacyl-CoA dehydrogenase / Enoyl-CoA hydratase [Arthrobacter rhombi]
MALKPYSTAVLDEWIDYNGHLSEAYYVLVFGFATDAAMEALGMGPAYREATSNSLYTVEAHVRYLDETGLGAELEVTTTVAGSGAKKLHLAHTMRVNGAVIATEEILGLHVNQETGKTLPFGQEILDGINVHRSDPPDWSGRSITC